MCRTRAASILLISSLVVCACRSVTSQPGDGKLRVVVSVTPQAWLVSQIGGEHVEVTTLVHPGESPATYQPTDAEVSRVMAADVYFRIGVPFENGPWFQAIQTSNQLHIVDARSGITLRPIEAHGHDDEAHDHGSHEGDHGTEARAGHGHNEHQGGDVTRKGPGNDPHIWLSPRLLKIQAETVARTLRELEPEHAGTFQRNLESLQSKLEAADRAIRKRLEPFRGKAFFVFHPAWGYFADEYGLRQVAIEIEGKEPSDHELTTLQAKARAEGIKVIFVQPQISGQSAQAVAETIGARVQTLDPLNKDVPDGLRRAAEAVAGSYD
jgi:zinc transport system substrate-binding protein